MFQPQLTIGPGVVLANKYQIIERIGAGGMGAVYRAREIDFHVDRSVAIKVLPPQYAGDPRLTRRFAEEIKIAAQLDHPHIVPIYFVGREADCLFFVMKHLRGETLKARVARSGPLPPRFVVRVMGQMARALDSIHRKGAIHRDIKSVNIMIDDDGNATLMDFGIAKMEGGAELTTTGEVLGTAPYMAPEQWHGQKDPRSDIYALGIVMYEALTGTPPFVSDKLPEVMDAHLRQAPQPVRDARPEVPEALAEVVHRCLEKIPDKRYATAGDLAQALDFVDRSLPPDLPADTPPPAPPPSDDPLAAAIAESDRQVNDGYPRQARQILSDAVGRATPPAEVIERLDKLAALAMSDDQAKVRAQKLLDQQKPAEAEKVIRDHLREYPASRIGNLLASIYQSPTGLRQAIYGADTPTRVAAEAATLIVRPPRRMWPKILAIAIALLVVAGAIGGTFVFSSATSKGLLYLGNHFYGRQWYVSPPVVNAAAAYHLALVYNNHNDDAKKALDNMAAHLYRTGREFRKRGDLNSAVQYLGWAIEINRDPDWVRTYEQYKQAQK